MTVRKVETNRKRSILLLPSQACLMSLYVVYCVPVGTMSYFNLQSPPKLLCRMEQTFINIGFIFPFLLLNSVSHDVILFVNMGLQL